MRVFFLKAKQFFSSKQPDLFDDTVYVKGYVKKDGKYVDPHTTRKKKKRVVPVKEKVKKPAELPEKKQMDLFGYDFDLEPKKKPEPQAVVNKEFKPTHELPDGTLVISFEDEPDTWEDADGNIIEDYSAFPYVADIQPKKQTHIEPGNEHNSHDDFYLFGNTWENVKDLQKMAENAAGKTKPVATLDDIELLAKLGIESVIEQKLFSVIDRLKNSRIIPKTVIVPSEVYNIVGGIDYDGDFKSITIPDFGVKTGIGKAERRKINDQVVALLKEKTKGFSDDELVLLSQYSGTGGVGDSLNEFYTRPDVAAAAWNILNNLGLSSGNVLEPSCGTGVFMATAPKNVKVTGVEVDSTSSLVAGILHPDHEINQSSMEAFATSDVRQFDGVVGNVPFGVRGSLIKDDKKELSTAEQYFLDAALDKTKTGGIVALVVPSGIMDSKTGRSFRERILRKGEFLGAHRMPNTAFEHSHTQVVTDLVVFRKRPQDVANALSVVDQEKLKELGVWDSDYLSGNYFYERGIDNIYGRMEDGWRTKAGMGNDITVTGSMAGVANELSKFSPKAVENKLSVSGIVESYGDDESAKKKVINAAVKQNYDHAELGDTKTVNGVSYILEGEPPRWHRVESTVHDSVTDSEKLVDSLDELFDLNQVDSDSSRVTQLREFISKELPKHIEKHGIPSKSKYIKDAAAVDKKYWRLIGAVNSDGSYSNLVTGSGSKDDKTDFASVATALSIKTGAFTADDLAEEWSGGDRDAVLDHLFASDAYAVDGDGKTWLAMDRYLTGELWDKYDACVESLKHEGISQHYLDKYELQRKELEEKIDAKSLDEVDFQINSAWIPVEYIEKWQNSNIEQYIESTPDSSWRPDDFKISFADGVYTLDGGLHETNLIAKYLNRLGVRKDDLGQVDELNEKFKQWVLVSNEREALEDLYNRKFKGFVSEEFNDEPIYVPGLSSDRSVNDYHWSGVKWALNNGKGIIAADVGLGKTTRALIMAKLMKTYGQAKKPVIVVPKSVIANWKKEIDSWFPGSNVLVIGENLEKGKADTAAERSKKLHELSQNDHYDFVIMSQPAFNDIEMNPIKKGEYVNDDFWVQRGDSLGKTGDKRLKKIRESYDQAVAKREFQKHDDTIYFEDLGIDGLIVDEMQSFKNLVSAKARYGNTPKFLGGSGLSNQAFDMNLKSRWIRENNDGKNVYGLSATPTKNSPLEVYSMLSHIAPEEFENRGIRNAEEFLDRFCQFELDSFLDPKGVIKEGSVTAGFKNMDELREVMFKHIDRTTAKDVGLKLPKAKEHQHLIDMTDAQRAVYADLAEQIGDVKKDSTGDAHIFSIMDKMRKAAIDLELLGDEHKGFVSPKYNAAADEIINGAKEGGQVVFIDSLDSHQKLADILAKKGIKASEIGIINAQSASSASKRQKISDDFNAGKLKVVIGNTATMGEGVNLQMGTTDIHHLDLPWEPASMQQRNGRGLRQGNISEAVRIHSYLSKGSFDGYRYQTIMAKKNWMDQLWGGGDKLENLSREGVVSKDDMLVMLAADPDAAAKELASNKAAQQERIDTAKRSEANNDFDAFTSMSRSHKAIKDKGSVAARRMKTKIDRLKSRLRMNKQFVSKEVLDMDKPAIIQPDTGDAWYDGVAFEMQPGTDSPINWSSEPSKWVVTGVNPLSKKVAIREYGKTKSHTMDVHLDKLNKGVSQFDYDKEVETGVIAKKVIGVQLSMATDLVSKRFWPGEKEKGNSMKVEIQSAVDEVTSSLNWTESTQMRAKMQVGIHDAIYKAAPKNVSDSKIEALANQVYFGVYSGANGIDLSTVQSVSQIKDYSELLKLENAKYVQSHLKDNIRGYRSGRDVDSYAFMDIDTGEPFAVVSYKARDNLDHDLLLPTEENRKVVEAGWIKEALNPKFTIKSHDMVTRENENHWKSIGSDYYGEQFNKRAYDKLKTIVSNNIRKADDFHDAVQAAKPLLTNKPKKGGFSSAVISDLYSSAKKHGVLDNDFKTEAKVTNSSNRLEDDDVHANLFQIQGAGGRTGKLVSGMSTNDALIELVTANGNLDLASSMIMDKAVRTKKDPVKTFEQLFSLGERVNTGGSYGKHGYSGVARYKKTHEPVVLQRMQELVKKHNLENTSTKEMLGNEASFRDDDDDHVFGRKIDTNDKPIGDILDAAING